MDTAADPNADYPSKLCAKAEKALIDALNKTRELTSMLPGEWLPNVYAYLHARCEGTSAADMISRVSDIATMGRTLAHHTPLMINESVDGIFCDSFFSKQAVSSEKDAQNTRSDIQSRACTAYSSFDGKFNQYIGSLRLHSITFKEAVPPKAADFKDSNGSYSLHNEEMQFKACIHDAKVPDLSSDLWFPVASSSTCKSESPGFAVLQLSTEDFQLFAEGNPSACTHLHLHGFVKQIFSKNVKFTWTMPLPSAALNEVVLEGYAQANLPSEKSYRTMRCAVSVRNTILMVVHPHSLKSDAIKAFGANVCSYYLHFISMLMNYSGKSISTHREASDLRIPVRKVSSANATSATLYQHHGFASHSGNFLARQLRARFCLPEQIYAAIELAVRVSNFSASRDMVADLLVAATSLCPQTDSHVCLSGSKFIDDLRKHASIVAREFSLDILSSFPTDLVIHEEVSSPLFDKIVVSVAVLISLDSTDQSAAIDSALKLGVKRTCLSVMKRIKNDAHESVVADLFRASIQDEFSLSTVDSKKQVFDLFTKQAQIELRASISLCNIILALLMKKQSFDSMLEQFNVENLDGSWYSSIAFDQAAKNKLFQGQRIIQQARVPFKLIVDLVKMLSQRARKMTLMSFDDCTNELWQFITLFFTLHDVLKDVEGFEVNCFDGITDVFKDITCGPSQTSWLSRLAIVQEQKLQEAIVADELHSLVEVSYMGSRVFLWLTDFISVASVMNAPQSSAISTDFHSILVFSHERFWELLMIFVGKASIEILKLCAQELQASTSSESAAASFGLSTVVRGIGGGINAAINFLDPTAKQGDEHKGVFATIKQTAFNTARAVRQGKGVISAAAEATKGTVKTAFSAVATTANVVVQAGALVASGVDAAASGVAGVVTGAAKAVGLGPSKLAKESSFAASTGSIFFTISLIRAIEETIKHGVSTSQSMLSDRRPTDRSDTADIESILQINFQKQYVEPLCSDVCSQASEFFESTFTPIIDGVLSGKHEINTAWEFAVIKGVNSIVVNVPEANPEPILKLAAQDLFKGYVDVVFDQFCSAVARCKRELGLHVNEQIAMESLQEFSNRLAKMLDDFSQNDFDGCASKLVTSFRARISKLLKMQFGTSKEDLLKMLQEMQANQGDDVLGDEFHDLPIVLEHKFERDSKIQAFLESLKHRKWRSAFDIPESDVFCDSAAVSIQDKLKDRSKFINGMLYITHHHICFLEDIDSAKDRVSARKQGTVDLGPIQVPASNARLRIQWVRGDHVIISHQDTTKIKVKGPLDASLYQNSCVLSQFRLLHPDTSSNTYLKCSYADQLSKSDPLKVRNALKADPAKLIFAFCHLNGQDFTFDADLTGGGEKSLLSVSLRNFAGLVTNKGSKRVICSHSFNPNDLSRDELREVYVPLDSDNPDRQTRIARSSQATGGSPSLSFYASRCIRREHIPSSSSGGEIVIRLQQQKVQSIRHILTVRTGDGRRVEPAVSEAQPSSIMPLNSEENDADVVEEGRFSCLYWNSQQSFRDAKLGTLVLTSDHISFESSSLTLMGCFIYEVKKVERKGGTNLVLYSEFEQHHFDSFTRFALTGPHKGNQRDCTVDILKKCYKQRFGDKELPLT